jgi:hypothetical protein
VNRKALVVDAGVIDLPQNAVHPSEKPTEWQRIAD